MEKKNFNLNWTCNGKAVQLPHDAQILEKRSAETSDGGHGYFPGGIYTYEKTFTAPTEWEGKQVFVEFEGVYKNRNITFNIYGVETRDANRKVSYVSEVISVNDPPTEFTG